eukprot:867721-Rhodomonas_salina.1
MGGGAKRCVCALRIPRVRRFAARGRGGYAVGAARKRRRRRGRRRGSSSVGEGLESGVRGLASS